MLGKLNFGYEGKIVYEQCAISLAETTNRLRTFIMETDEKEIVRLLSETSPSAFERLHKIIHECQTGAELKNGATVGQQAKG